MFDSNGEKKLPDLYIDINYEITDFDNKSIELNSSVNYLNQLSGNYNLVVLITENNIKTIVTINSINNDSLDELIKLALAKGDVIKLTEPVHALQLGAKQSNIGTYKNLMIANSDTIIDGMKN